MAALAATTDVADMANSAAMSATVDNMRVVG